LRLVRQAGPSENGAHRHSSHMLSLQLNGAVQIDWSDSASSRSAMIGPGALTLLPAGSRHAKCSVRSHDSAEKPAQLVALMSHPIIEASSGARVELKESRRSRDCNWSACCWCSMRRRWIRPLHLPSFVC